MHRKIIAVLSLVPVLLSLGCGADTSSPATKAKVANAQAKVKEAVDATIEAAKAKRDEYAREMSKRIDELNAKYEELKDQAAKATGDAKKELDKKLEHAKSKRDAALKKLDELKDASADRWEKIKDGVGAAFEELKKTFE